MSKTENEQPILPLFHLSKKFPDAKSIFSVSIPSVKDFIDEALIVLDTNVLLIPYDVQPKSLDDIRNAYKRLIDENRLFIPAQVAREFAKNRGEKIKNLFHNISLKQDTNIKKVDYRLLEPIAEYEELLKLEDELLSKIKDYRKVVSSVLDRIRSWRWNDPVSNLYRELFLPEIIIETSKSPEEIERDLNERLENKIPPGFKDSGKDDRGIGDIIIWNTILNLGEENKRSIIFVTGDEKTDWMLRSNNEGLYPNFELIDEFSRVSDGKIFHIIKFSELLDHLGAQKEVVAEVKNEELEIKHHSYAWRSEREQFYIKAENSVFNWFQNKYEAKDITIHSTGFIDLIVELQNGKLIGVIIKAVMTSNSIRAKFRTWAHQAATMLAASNLDECVIVIVSSDSNKAEDYFNWILNKKDENDKQIEIILGYLDAYNKFEAIYDNLYKKIL